LEHGRVAPVAVDLVVPGVHGVDRPVEPTAPELGHHLPAERARLHRRADHRHRTSLEHPLEARPRIAIAGSGAHFDPTARSFFAWRYACQPGMPFTPPPACVALEPWYRPFNGV